MTSPQPLPVPTQARAALAPIDPRSDAGQNAARVLGEVFDSAAERLRREGKPVPACIAP